MTPRTPRLPTPRSAEGEPHHSLGEDGFSFVEMMVVVLIIAILLAIAIPFLLGASTSAGERVGQSNLTSALTEMKTLFPSTQSYSTVAIPSSTLTSSAPEFTWAQSGACTAAQGNCVSEYPVDVTNSGDGQGVILATPSRGSWCWYVADLKVAPTTSGFADGSGTVQFLAGNSDGNTPNMQNAGGSPLTRAGVFYSRRHTASCDARTPTTNATSWGWSSTLSGATVN